ncbi:MAG: type II secretion system F family protein [Verrucomicrobiales bacterium]
MNVLDQRALLHRELARLLEAGFPIDKAATTLLARNPDSLRRRMLEALRDGLQAGGTIAGSLQPAVTPMEFSLLEASEKGGRIADGFAYLAEFFMMRSRTRSQAIAGLIYPLLVLHLAVVPAALMVNFGKDLKLFFPTALALLGVLYGVVGAVFFAGRWLLRRGEYDRLTDSLLRRVPVFGTWRRSESLSRFCKVLEISLLAGRLPSEAVTLAASAANSALVRAAAERISSETAAGYPLGPSMAGDKAFPVELADSLTSAEIAGSLEKEAGRWSGYFQSEANQAAQLVAAWLPRLVYGVAVLVVIVVAVRFVLNYVNLLNGLMPE